MVVRGLLVLIAVLLAACSGSDSTDGNPVDVPDNVSLEVPAELETSGACGDGLCSGDESCQSCAQDCGDCCGNGVCDKYPTENCFTCPEDCGDVCEETPCGDGVCDMDNADGYTESCQTCPKDCECPPGCGDGNLDEGEECDDGNLDPGDGCDTDCKTEHPESCSNSACEPDLGENCVTCPEDCTECCPDGLCDQDGGETCETCPDDCGGPCVVPGCGDGTLQIEDGEQCDDGNKDPDDGCDENCQLEIVDGVPGSVIVTEIMKDPDAVDDISGEWVELFNTSDADIDITGWWLKDEDQDEHQILATDPVVVPAKGFIVVAREGDPTANGGVTAAYVYSGFSLSNKDDEVILYSNAVLIDSVKYDDGAEFPDKEGKSLTLSSDMFTAEDNDLGSSWCLGDTAFGAGDLGTPGEPNRDCTPEPECGNGTVEGDEECDDGAKLPDDGCDENCQVETFCGDGTCDQDDGETCESCPDDCDALCPTECGDGAVEGNEACDDANDDECDGCTSLCTAQGCGDTVCNCGENVSTCDDDCGPFCGDGLCTDGENCLECMQDCGTCCPNGTCDVTLGETCTLCPADCGACPPECGNGVPEGNEACDDGNVFVCDGCSPQCTIQGAGNGICEEIECQEHCGMVNPDPDCGKCCGDGKCVANDGETCQTCPQDCTQGCPATCGNGAKEGAEECDDGNKLDNDGCSAACKTEFCGDKICNNKETCTSCVGDCGACPPVGWCQLSGNQGASLTCDVKLAAESAASPKAAGLQFKINYDAAKVTLSKFSCEAAIDYCDMLSLLISGHTIATDPAKALWNGLVSVLIYHASDPSKIVTDAYLTGGNVTGNAQVMKLVFTLKTTIAAASPVSVTLTNLAATDANANSLSVTMTNGVLISKAGGALVCGNSICDAGETCTNCAQDCVCCGNNKVDAGETCDDGNKVSGDGCSSTCQTESACPNGVCGAGESCTNCPQDCGACPPSSWCQISGNQGATVACDIKLAAATAASKKAAGLQFKINYDATKVTLAKFSCENAIDYCDALSMLLTLHTIAVDPPKAAWNGLVSVLIYHASIPTTLITDAYMSGGNVTGNAQVMKLMFTLKTTISAGSPVGVTLTGLGATDADANGLAVSMQNGVLVSTP